MVKYLMLCTLVGLAVMAWSEIPIKRGPGISAEYAPEYIESINKEPIQFNGNTFEPFREITAEVRVVEKRRYFFDNMSKFSSYDILVSWGEASDQKNLDYINFKLKNRSFEFKRIRLPLEIDTINELTDLWHIVPANDEVSDQIFNLRNGHLINLKGYVVDVTTNNGMTWTSVSSDNRISKSGNRHEILLVTSLTKK